MNRHLTSTRIRHVMICGTVLACTGWLFGCKTDAQSGLGLGAAAGAIAGGIIGHQSGHGLEGAAIGAGVGGGAGYIIGNESDKDKARRYDSNYDY